MTLLCIAPSPWWSLSTNEPCTGPVFGEVCNAVCEVQGGYVIDGYGEEPYDAVWFVEWVGVEVGKEEFEYA